MRGYKPSEYTLADALSALSDIDDLRDELQEWYDNLPESFQNGSKGEQLQEAIDNLQDVDSVEACLPSELEHLSAEKFTVLVHRHAKSRSKRRDDAVSALRAAQELLAQKADDYRAQAEEVEDVSEALAKRAKDDQMPLTADELNAAADAAESLASELDDAIGNFENAEFPGMYG